MSTKGNPLRICVLGAESTGKSSLCAQLVPALRLATGQGLEQVHEVLREFSAAKGRTPQREEQAGLIELQASLENSAATRADIVISDSAPVAVAIYSEIYFQDASLIEVASRHHTCYDVTLVANPDFPWQADSTAFMRDGPAMQRRFHERLLTWLDANQIRHVHLNGPEIERRDDALAVILRLIR